MLCVLAYMVRMIGLRWQTFVSSKKRFVSHPLLVRYDLARREDEADLEDHSEEL